MSSSPYAYCMPSPCSSELDHEVTVDTRAAMSFPRPIAKPSHPHSVFTATAMTSSPSASTSASPHRSLKIHSLLNPTVPATDKISFAPARSPPPTPESIEPPSSPIIIESNDRPASAWLPVGPSPRLRSRPLAPATLDRSNLTKTMDPVFTPGVPKDPIVFPPFEDDDPYVFQNMSTAEVGDLLDQHDLFDICPSARKGQGRIASFQRHVPYTSEKKAFASDFQLFSYSFRVPSKPDQPKHFVMWDYQSGYVRITPFFKALDYSKTTPARALTTNPGLKALSLSITGGSVAAQGYWMPFEKARALCLTFCHDIRFALTPIFGPSFVNECLRPNDPMFGKFKISSVMAPENHQSPAHLQQARQPPNHQHPQHLQQPQQGDALIPPTAQLYSHAQTTPQGHSHVQTTPQVHPNAQPIPSNGLHAYHHSPRSNWHSQQTQQSSEHMPLTSHIYQSDTYAIPQNSQPRHPARFVHCDEVASTMSHSTVGEYDRQSTPSSTHDQETPGARPRSSSRHVSFAPGSPFSAMSHRLSKGRHSPQLSPKTIKPALAHSPQHASRYRSNDHAQRRIPHSTPDAGPSKRHRRPSIHHASTKPLSKSKRRFSTIVDADSHSDEAADEPYADNNDDDDDRDGTYEARNSPSSASSDDRGSSAISESDEDDINIPMSVTKRQRLRAPSTSRTASVSSSTRAMPAPPLPTTTTSRWKGKGRATTTAPTDPNRIHPVEDYHVRPHPGAHASDEEAAAFLLFGLHHRDRQEARKAADLPPLEY